MARLRIRDPSDTYWIDVCFSQWYLRNPSNTGWRRILPGATLYVRSSGNKRWLPVNCSTFGEANLLCDGSDPYDPSNPLTPNRPGVVTTPGGTTPGGGGGGGTGGGSGGTGGTGGVGTNNGTNGTYTPGGGSGTSGGTGGTYTPGYGISGGGPDGGPTVINDPNSPTGISVVTGTGTGTTIQTWDGHANGTTDGDGTTASPMHCPGTIFSGGTNIMESIFDLGSVSGLTKLFVLVYSGSVTIRIYHAGQLLVDSGLLTNRTNIVRFLYDPSQHANETQVLIQAQTNDASSYFMCSVPCPTSQPDDDDPGSPNNPEPCHAVIQPTWGSGVGVQETYHELGNTSGNLTIEYQMFDQPDKLSVWYKGVRLGGTAGYVSGEGYFQVHYASDGVVTSVVVRVESQEQGTSYIYRMYCPGQTGSVIDPTPCNEVTQGSGASTVDTHYAFGTTEGVVVVEYITFEISDKMEIYQGNVLKANTGFVSTSNIDSIAFYYNPNNSQKVLIRMIGSVNSTDTTWAFKPYCPVVFPVVQIRPVTGGQIQNEGNSGQGVFPVEIYLDKPAPLQCTVDYTVVYSANADATDVPAQTHTITFNRGEYVKQGSILYNTDLTIEPDEAFAVQLVNPVYLTIGATSIVSLTLRNDDNPDPVTISVVPAANTGANITEGDSGLTYACADIVLSNPTQVAVTVHYAFNYGTAGASDVNLSSGTVTINPGETFKRACCTVIGDTAVEGQETFTCTISNPSFGSITTNATTFYINDDDVTVYPCGGTSRQDFQSGAHTYYHELGTTPGNLVIQYDMQNNGDRMDVYWNGTQIATTGGFVAGTGNFNIPWNPQVGQPTQIAITMTTGPSSTVWTYWVYCPG